MNKMFFWVPLTLILTVIWVLLSNSLDASQVLLGFTVSMIMVMLSLRMRPHLAYPRKIFTIYKLCGLVLFDMITSNLHLIRHILWNSKDVNPGYVYIPLKIRDPHAIAFLSCIVTYTPGTVWASLSEKDYILRLHVLDLHDEHVWYETIKNRYEKPLMEIFE
ncbi:Na+/H+ antiporter subunit E [Taylorella equigenitalis]|uniref:Na+/H+ antiporter subunit E n=1 Tax=Taylorella equigenitalis TaxID=29575 RepID=UPI0004128F72|nr:Na+/H+ antiporter subunit E [Taylorella equigenitalis]